MAYRAPGVYSNFVRSAAGVNNPGASRILALIGTGVQTYTVYNEPVVRSAEASADVLLNPNVYQIIAVTSKPYYQTGGLQNTITFTASGTAGTSNKPEYNLVQGEYISWIPVSGTVNQPTIQPGPTNGAQQWVAAQTTATIGGVAQQVADITATLDTSDPQVQVNGANANESFLLESGQFMVEITYVDNQAGTYRITNMGTGDILGEYVVSSTPNYEAIPGVALTVETTFVADPTDPTGKTSLTQVGDYVLVTTTAGTTAGTPTTMSTVNSDGSLTLSDGTKYTQPKSPNTGDVYYVSYKYRKATSDYLPKLFTNFQDIVAEYGAYSVTAAGRVINSLTLGAEVAMANGAAQIVCVQAKSENDLDINNAIDLLMQAYPGIDTVNAVVPLTGFWNSYNVAAHLGNHCLQMSLPDYAKERIGYTTAISPTETVSQIVSTLQTFQNERLVYTVPASVTKDIKDPNTNQIATRTIPGSFMAAAVAAIAIGQDPAEPLTGKQVNGFRSLGNLYAESDMNLIAGNGGLVLKQTGAVIRVRHGITTATTDIDSSEITVVQIKDYVIDAVRKALDAAYVGRKLIPTLVADVKTTLQNVLNQFVAQQVILSFNIVSVARDANNPTQVNVSFQIEAVYPLNYIDVEFGFSHAAA